MADLHYFPLLAGDWLAGEAISRMTPEQEGAFVHLLCHCWNSQSLPCTLPNDDKALAQLSRLGRRWKKIGALIREQFREVDGDPTRIYNPKLWTVYQEAKAVHDKKVEGGRRGGMAKARAYQKPSTPSGTPSSKELAESSNQNQSQTQTTDTTAGNPKVPDSGYPPEFELLWKTYPRRNPASNKAGTYRLYQGHLKNGVAYDVMFEGTKRYAAACIAKGWVGTEFVKDAKTFFGRDKHFLDDFQVAEAGQEPSKLWQVMKEYGFTTATRFTIDADLQRAKSDGKITDPTAFKNTLRKLNRDALKNARTDADAERIIRESLAGEKAEGLAA